MICNVQNLCHGRDQLLDFNGNPLFQRYIRHATSLASTVKPDIGPILLQVDKRNTAAMRRNRGINPFLKQLLDRKPLPVF